MPTIAEIYALVALGGEWVANYNGVAGWKFTGNGNSIFLPAAGLRIEDFLGSTGAYGYYWSSSLFSANPGQARALLFFSSAAGWTEADRIFGESVRPVFSE